MSTESVILSNYLIFCHPVSFWLQSFPASVSLPKSRLVPSGSQSIKASASATVIPMKIQGWRLLGLTGFISLQYKGLSRVFYSTTFQRHQFFGTQHSLWSNSYIHTWLLEKPQLWLYGPLLAKWVLCFLIRCLGLCWLSLQGASKRLLSSWQQSISTIIFGAQEKKICHSFHFFPIYLPWSDGTGWHDLCFLIVEF